MSIPLENDLRRALGMYVHAPFCSSTCDFCAFYQEKPRKNSVKKFLSSLNAEWKLVSPGRRIDTVYLGGGTPGALATSDLKRLCDFIQEASGGEAVEWTTELAPSETTPEKLAVLRDAGVTRISMGIQSFQSRILESLGREHPPQRLRRAYDWIREAGFEEVNLDLIFCVPGQSLSDWRSDLEIAVSWEPDHLSTYCLIYEEKAALFAKVKRGEVGPDLEEEERFYSFTWDFLRGAGYNQYEVANFSRKEKRCRHNWNVWRMNEWIGLGPSAASQRGSERWSNTASLDRWGDAVTKGRLSREEVVCLTPRELAEDYMLFGLRLNEGVNLAELARRWPEVELASLLPFLHRLVQEGLMEQVGESYSVTDQGRLVVDRLGSEVVDQMKAMT